MYVLKQFDFEYKTQDYTKSGEFVNILKGALRKMSKSLVNELEYSFNKIKITRLPIRYCRDWRTLNCFRAGCCAWFWRPLINFYFKYG